MRHVREAVLGMVLGAVCVVGMSGCSSVQSAASAVPGASYIPGLSEDESGEPKEGDKLHLKISPDDALVILSEVAPQHGWKLAAVGEQHDLQGLRGKYFRLETIRFLGGATEMNGVFFLEEGGAYVIVGKRHTGLPEELVTPFISAVRERTGTIVSGAGTVANEVEPASDGVKSAAEEKQSEDGEVETDAAP